MAAKFNMKDLLNAQSTKAPDSPESGSHSIVDIPLDKLVPSPRNKYGIRDIEEMASSIEEMGLFHNLVARRLPDCDKYEIISGERRYWGIKSLYDSGHTEWAVVPCKIDNSVSDDMAELKLLIANCQTRTLTDYEKLYQAQRAKDIMLNLKKEGHKFTGRTRDNVALLIGVSPSQMGRIDSISNHLSDDFMEQFKNGGIGISAAYELSCLSGSEQEKAFINFQQHGNLSVKSARETRKSDPYKTPPALEESDNKIAEQFEPVPPVSEAVPRPTHIPELDSCPLCGDKLTNLTYEENRIYRTECKGCKTIFLHESTSYANAVIELNRRYSG